MAIQIEFQLTRDNSSLAVMGDKMEWDDDE